MATVLPKSTASSIKKSVYTKADEFCYSTRSRTENNQFLDSLVEDPEIGGVLREYMPKEKVRTYIKDGILNAYAKQFTKNALDIISPASTIKKIYGVSSSLIQQGTGKDARVSVLRSEDGHIFVVSGGTLLKWETALRKALELIAREPGLYVAGQPPKICLQLVVANSELSTADKKHISTALGVVSVNADFCNK